MEGKIKKFFEPVVLSPVQSIPWSDADTIDGHEREVAEAEKGSFDELKSECIMRLSWALVHSERPEDVQRGIAMLDGEKLDAESSVPLSSLAGISSPLQTREKLHLLAVGYYRSGDYSRSRQLVERCLEIAPDWMEALTLKKAIEDQITTDQSLFLSQPSQTSGLQHRTKQKKKKGQVQMRERNPNWSKEEDEALCKAWLYISENPDVCTDPRAKLWDRIRDEFINILGYETDRVSSGLMNRWSSIQPHLIKYSGFVRTVERTRKSGYNVEELIGAARQLYYNSEGHHFKWDGCWLILKDSTKWCIYTQEQEGKKQKIVQRKRDCLNLDADQALDYSNPSALATPGSDAGSVSHDDEGSPFNQGSHELPRPPGRKAAKKIRRKKIVDQLEAISLFVEEFSNLRKEQKEIAEQELIMVNQREKMKIQAKQEQGRWRVEAKLEQERMRIAAKREQEQTRMEKEIMMTDPNSIPTEEGKAWVIAQQKAIWRVEAKLEQERMRIAAEREVAQMRLEKEIMMTDPNSIPTEEGKAWFLAQQKAIGACAGSSGSGSFT